MNRILLQATSATVMLGLPALVFVGFCGRSLLTLIYGQRYSVAALALVLAACASFLNILNVQLTLMFYAKGRPGLHRRSVAAMAVVVVVLIYPLAKGFGLWGGQLACLIAVVVGYLLQVERIRKVTGLRLAEYWKSFLIPAAASLVIVAIWLVTGVHWSAGPAGSQYRHWRFCLFPGLWLCRRDLFPWGPGNRIMEEGAFQNGLSTKG